MNDIGTKHPDLAKVTNLDTQATDLDHASFVWAFQAPDVTGAVDYYCMRAGLDQNVASIGIYYRGKDAARRKQFRFNIQKKLLSIDVPEAHLPGEIRDCGSYIIALIAKARRKDAIEMSAGTFDSFRQVFYDLCDVANFDINIRLPHNHRDHPDSRGTECWKATSIPVDARNVTERQVDDISAIVRRIFHYFWPYGSNPHRPLYDLHERMDITKWFSPIQETGHGKMEAAGRLRAFLQSHAANLGFDDRSLSRTLQTLGLEKAS